MSFKLGLRSRLNLRGVHPDLVRVVERAIQITAVDFTVIEGVRTPIRQSKLYASGASKTLNSRHITGHAVDVVPYINGRISWRWPDFHPVVAAMKAAAAELDIEITCGADWESFPDGPHHQLSWGKYPA